MADTISEIFRLRKIAYARGWTPAGLGERIGEVLEPDLYLEALTEVLEEEAPGSTE